jgi:hypothetical protein
MSKLALTCDDWKALRKITLLGFATIKIEATRLTIKDIAVHEKGDRRWAQLPAKPQLKDGRAVTDTSGKAQYVPIMSFDSRDVADAFSAAVVKAILEHEPRAFDADQGQKSAPCNDFHDDEVPF